MRALILFLLILQGSAYTVDVTDTGYAVITHEIVITASQEIDSYSYYVPFPISHLDVYSDKAVRGDYTVMGRYTEVTLHFSLKEGESVYCICEYLSWEIIFKEGTQWWLYLPAMEESATVIMPEGAAVSYLVTESDFPSVSEEKGRIHLFWEEVPDDVYVYYEMSSDGSSEWGLTALVGIGVGVSIGIAAVVLMYVRKRRSHKLNPHVLSVLSERERKIVEYLYAKGRSRQAKISRDCNIPKTSLSKILMKMEERGIIKREKDGRLTFCELDEKVYQY
ncbi:MAG: winged helix-turn-helix transcriptional regulator [Theionarchaea archaeon]|nr:MAG: hypothetical protein AYK19_21335 [Theionarchaea archaeon DG-70-1]MBU7029429.1 winged helix-turn-helix transcriptional regulator [Theionarchaea archaeon]